MEVERGGQMVECLMLIGIKSCGHAYLTIGLFLAVQGLFSAKATLPLVEFRDSFPRRPIRDCYWASPPGWAQLSPISEAENQPSRLLLFFIDIDRKRLK
jgi:hypothetical protein